MNHCEEFQALLDPFVDGELAPDAMAQVQEHLDACPACRDYVDSVLAIRAAFPSVEDTKVPENFAEDVMARVRANTSTNANAPGRTVVVNFRRRWMGVAAAFAACCAIVILLRTGPAGLGGMDGGAPVTANDDSVQTEAACDSPADQSDINEDGLADEAGMDTGGTVDKPAAKPTEKSAGEPIGGLAEEDETAASYTAGTLPESAAGSEEGNLSPRMSEIAPQSGGVPIYEEDAGDTVAGKENADARSSRESVQPASETAAVDSDCVPAEYANTSESREEAETPVVSFAPPASSLETETPDLLLSSEEAGSLLDDFTPAEDRGTERVYLLTREEFAALLEELPPSAKPEQTGDKEILTVVVTAA